MLGLRCRAPWQLVVVDNGSTDGTWQWLRTISAPGGVSFDAVEEPAPGLSRARNAGVRAARGEIVAFTDDDCYPTASYLDDLLEVFASPEIDYCGGRVLLYDSADLPVTIKTSVVPVCFPSKTFIETGSIHGANMAFRRQVLDTTGPFDVLLGAGSVTHSAEDSDLVFRASWNGYRGQYAPGSAVLHHHRRSTQAELARLQRAYDLGRGAFYVKHIRARATRLLVMKHWYWSLSAREWRGLPQLARELQGALIYLWHERALRRQARPWGRPTPAG